MERKPELAAAAQVVVALIGLLSAIVIPYFVRARVQSHKNICINNLRQIDAAKQQWALETKQGTNATPVYSAIKDYMKNEVICPAGGTAFGPAASEAA